MSVNFKVPASPKKSIFVIDEFQGVDLTNTGSNIDETRSPNAENMVRFVPGKVRKRTGYHTKVNFGDPKDINRALATSDEFVEIPGVKPSFAERTILYNCASDILANYIYFQIRGHGSYRFGQTYTDGSSTYNSGWDSGSGDFDKTCWRYNGSETKKTHQFYVYRLSNDPDDYLEISSFRSCHTSAATTLAEWKDLPWTAAPEDEGKIFVERSLIKPVYGCHPLKSGSFVGNIVVNVNRALNTSDTFASFTVNDSGWTTEYKLGNTVYRTPSNGECTPITVEFDYISDAQAYVSAAGWYSTDNIIENTNGDVYHYSSMMKRGSYQNYVVNLKALSGTANIQIKNMSVLYEKNENYTWTPAPEDSGDIFHIEDVYNIGSKNYATIDSFSYTDTSVGLTLTKDVYFADATSNVKGFAKISFDFYTTTTTELDYVHLGLADDTPVYIYAPSKNFHSNVNNQHIEYYVCATSGTHYIDHLWVQFHLKTTDGSCTFRLANFEVKEITGRESYDISNKYYIYHVGKNFYLRASNSTKVVEVFSDANEHISKSWQLNEKLFILDGKNIYSYTVGDENVEVLTSGGGYIPLVTISKTPDGGGTSYESLNMLQPGFYEQFIVTSADASKTAFHLSFSGLDDTKTKVWLLDSNANWVEKTEGTHYTVNRGAGIINFSTAPGVSPVTGQDNVKVLAYRTVPGYADRVAKCTIGTLFGVGGAADRLFLSGNPDHPNWDFYSEQYNPTYFPDTGYSALGTSASAIVGYAIVNNYLATFKDDFDTSQAVFIREGDLVIDNDTGTSEPAFRLINTLQGNGVVAPYSFGYLQTEPVFLTRSGIYAITAQDITGEKYSQNRSFYLDGYLTEEEHLENAVSTVFNDQYILAINNKFYILDGLQATRTDKSEPYATRQYVGFYCTNIPATSIWTDEQALWIGTHDGRVCRFATDIEDLESYNDDGDPIYCCWETPDLSGKLFYKNKTFRYFAIRMMKAIKTSVKLYSQKLGTWSFIKEDTRTGLAFDFETIDFERFSFSTDRSEKVVHTKVRVKKVDKARFKVENEALNEPFGLFDWALEFIESGNYKG